ncbi:MAG: hypothetical protein HPY50_01970 [Firmicutes bacterium]|nr:hypothetical protein [Bacillota bacterium]
MKFNFTEWGKIKHALEVAQREYIKEMEDSKVSEDPTSMYQIFKRQAAEMQVYIDRIANAEI